MSTPQYRQIKQKDLARFRQFIYDKREGICPILKQVIPFTDTVVDHKHGRKGQSTGYEGKGLIRGVLQTQANAIEGKIYNSYLRMGLKKYIDLPTLLRNIADYIENPPEGHIYIHPSEIPKTPKVNKVCYRKMVNAFKKKYPNRKVPSLSKKGTLTAETERYFKEFNIEIKYIKWRNSCGTQMNTV